MLVNLSHTADQDTCHIAILIPCQAGFRMYMRQIRFQQVPADQDFLRYIAGVRMGMARISGDLFFAAGQLPFMLITVFCMRMSRIRRSFFLSAVQLPDVFIAVLCMRMPRIASAFRKTADQISALIVAVLCMEMSFHSRAFILSADQLSCVHQNIAAVCMNVPFVRRPFCLAADQVAGICQGIACLGVRMPFHSRALGFRTHKYFLCRIASFSVLVSFIFRNETDQIAIAVIAAGAVFMKNKIGVTADQFAGQASFLVPGITVLRMNMDILKIRIHFPADQLRRLLITVAGLRMDMLFQSAERGCILSCSTVSI